MEKGMSRPASGDDDVLLSARRAIASAKTLNFYLDGPGGGRNFFTPSNDQQCRQRL